MTDRTDLRDFRAARDRARSGERVNLDEIPAKGVIAFAYLVLPGSILAYTAFVWLLQNASVSTATSYAYVNPVIALLLGWALVDEPIGLLTLASAALILAAVAVVLKRETDASRERSRRYANRENAPAAMAGNVRRSEDPA